MPAVLAAETPQPPLLTPEAVRSRLETLPHWRTNETGTALIHQRTLADFGSVVNFVRCLVPIADATQHHPDIAIRYNQLTLTLTTHDAGGLTELDFQLADEINRLRCPLLAAPGQDNDAP
jgi:4a-hydroxytetrahydrobiopterin dehydratase